MARSRRSRALVEDSRSWVSSVLWDLQATAEKLDFWGAKAGRIFLCGSQDAGKTRLKCTMMQSMDKKSRSKSVIYLLAAKVKTRSTTGIEVELLVDDAHRTISLWDLAGQEIFRALQNTVLIPSVNQAILFVIVFNPFEVKITGRSRALKANVYNALDVELRSWLRFIVSNTYSRQVRRTRLPRILLIITHRDKLMGGELSTEELEKVVNTVKEDYQGVVQFCVANGGVHENKCFFHVNAKSQKEVQTIMDMLLSEMELEFWYKIAKVPTLCSDIVSTLWKRPPEVLACPLLNRAKFNDLLLTKWVQKYIPRISNMSINEKRSILDCIVWYLEDVGAIYTVSRGSRDNNDDQLVVLDMNWMAQDLIGEILSQSYQIDVESGCSSAFEQSGEVENGLVQGFQFKNMIMKALKKNSSKVIELNIVRELLLGMNLCYEIESKDRFFAPTFFARGRINPGWLTWDEEYVGNSYEYVGVRVAVGDQRTSLTSVFFSQFQIHLQKLVREHGVYDDTFHFYQDYMKIYFPSAVIFVEVDNHEFSYVDIIARYSQKEWKITPRPLELIYRELINFCASKKGCPGVQLLVFMMKTESVQKLKPRALREMKLEGKSRFGTRTRTTKDRIDHTLGPQRTPRGKKALPDLKSEKYVEVARKKAKLMKQIEETENKLINAKYKTVAREKADLIKEIEETQKKLINLQYGEHSANQTKELHQLDVLMMNRIDHTLGPQRTPRGKKALRMPDHKKKVARKKGNLMNEIEETENKFINAQYKTVAREKADLMKEIEETQKKLINFQCGEHSANQTKELHQLDVLMMASKRLRLELSNYFRGEISHEFDPAKTLILSRSCKAAVEMFFAHTEGMAALFGVAVPFSWLLLRDDYVVEVHQLDPSRWLDPWINSTTKDYSFWILDLGMDSVRTSKSTSVVLTEEEAAEQFGVGIRRTANLVHMHDGKDRRLQNEMLCTPSWMKSFIRLLRSKHNEEDERKQAQSGDEQAELEWCGQEDTKVEAANRGKDQTSMATGSILDQAQGSLSRLHLPLETPEPQLVHKFLTVIIFLDPRLCTFRNASESLNMFLDLATQKCITYHSTNGEVFRNHPSNVLGQFSMIPRVRIDFYYNPNLPELQAKAFRTRLEVSYPLRSKNSEPSLFGWYHDKLRLSFRCVDTKHLERVSIEPSENKILSNHLIRSADVGDSRENSTGRLEGKGYEVTGSGSLGGFGGLQLGLALTKESTVGRAQSQNISTPVSVRCLKSSGYSLIEDARANELAYTANIFPPLEQLDIWYPRQRQIALATGITANVTLDVQGQWIIIENNVSDSERFCSYMFSCGRLLQMQENPSLAASSTSTDSTSSIVTTSWKQKLVQAFIINHSYSHMRRLERPTAYIWDRSTRTASPAFEMIN